MLNRSGKSIHLCVILDLRRAGIGRLDKGIVTLTRKTDNVQVIRVDWCERILFADDIRLTLGGPGVEERASQGKIILKGKALRENVYGIYE